MSKAHDNEHYEVFLSENKKGYSAEITFWDRDASKAVVRITDPKGVKTEYDYDMYSGEPKIYEDIYEDSDFYLHIRPMDAETAKKDLSFNPIDKPSHYASGSIECIDAMESAYGIDAVIAFCKCNAFKYQWRFDKKNGNEDLKKADWYNNKYMELSKRKK